jgi:O-glycosyl hydrolase
MWTTAGAKRHERQAARAWAKPGGAAANTIAIDPADEAQVVLGFGGAFTDAACFTLHRLDAGARKQLFHQLFHPSELGLSVGRVCIGSSDYSGLLALTSQCGFRRSFCFALVSRFYGQAEASC